MDAEDAKFINDRIREDYALNWLVDGLPAAEMKQDLKTGDIFFDMGFNLGNDEGEFLNRPALHNHYEIVFRRGPFIWKLLVIRLMFVLTRYHTPSPGNHRVVGVLVWPSRYLIPSTSRNTLLMLHVVNQYWWYSGRHATLRRRPPNSSFGNNEERYSLYIPGHLERKFKPFSPSLDFYTDSVNSQESDTPWVKHIPFVFDAALLSSFPGHTLGQLPPHLRPTYTLVQFDQLTRYCRVSLCHGFYDPTAKCFARCKASAIITGVARLNFITF